jgi:hypothetical protein
MAEQRFDALFQGLERHAEPEATFADSLFDTLAAEAGLRVGARPGRSRLPRWAGETTGAARWLAWAALLAALLVVAAGLLLAGAGRRPVPAPPATPAASEGLPRSLAPAPSPHIGSTVLSIGSAPPAWGGTLVDGGSFTTTSLAGRPAAMLIWCPCVAGPQARLFASAAAARGDEVSFVLVSEALDGTTRGLVDLLEPQMPVVADPQSEILSAWGLDGFPALVLLRGDGTLADIQPQTFDQPRLTEILDALVGDAPIPGPVVRTPAPTDSAGLVATSTVLRPGVVAPVLSGRLLGGGARSTDSLRGRPLVIVFLMAPRRDGTPLDDVPLPTALLDDASRRGARVVLVTEEEAEAGDTRRYLDRIGWTGDVLVDWAGELEDRWGLTLTSSVVVLDGAGRVLRVAGSTPGTDLSGVLDALPSAAPS